MNVHFFFQCNRSELFVLEKNHAPCHDVSSLQELLEQDVPKSIKISQLSSHEGIVSVAHLLKAYAHTIPIVLDLLNLSGLEPPVLEACRMWLVPISDVLCASQQSSILLTESDRETVPIQAQQMLQMGAHSVLIETHCAHSAISEPTCTHHLGQTEYFFLNQEGVMRWLERDSTYSKDAYSFEICVQLAQGCDLLSACLNTSFMRQKTVS